MNFTVFLLIMVVWLLIACVPAYIVGVRCEVSKPGLAFIPIVGPWIVIFQSIGVSAWLTCIAVLPYVGLLVGLWAAWAVPDRHERSWLWSFWFIVPGLNLIGFWVYAFTLTPATELMAASTPPPAAERVAAFMKRDRSAPVSESPDHAMTVARERFARGELTVEEFEKIRDTLRT